MSVQLERSDCGGEISEKQSLWGIEISPLSFLVLALRSSALTDYIY